MKTKKVVNASLARSIGSTLRLIRSFRGESSDAVAFILGYKYPSSYCKLERGEIKEFSIESLLKFCNHFDINLLMLLHIVEQTEKIDFKHIIPHGRQLHEFINAHDKQLIDEIIKYKRV